MRFCVETCFLVWRRRGDAINPALFALLVASLFPLAIGPEPKLLSQIAPGIIWVALLLASLLSLDTLFRSDLEDGSLEQLLLAPQPLALMIFVKVLVHWLTTSLPGQAAIGALRIAAIDAVATIGETAVDIAPSTLDLAAPQGRIARQGRIPFDAAETLALTLKTDALNVAAADAPALQVAGAVQLGGPRAALVLTPDVSLQRAGRPRAQATGRIALHDGAWRAEGLQLQSGSSLLALDGTP